MSIREEERLAIGIDVGATKIAAALVDRRGDVVADRRTATGAAHGSAAVVERVADVARALLSVAPTAVEGIGVGTPGYVDPVAGVVSNAVNLSWEKVNLVDELKQRLATDLQDGQGIWIENDANVMALGEYYYGAALGCGHLVYVSIGSGLGSGIIVDHNLVSGAQYRAAELGHISLDPDGRRCACGQRGCIETVVSGPGILATAKELLATVAQSSLLEARPLTPEAIVEAALRGEPLAVQVLEVTASWLGQALAFCVAVLNPARIAVGGGLGVAAFDLLRLGVLREFERRIMPLAYADLRIVPSRVYSSAVGASSLVWHAGQDVHAS